MFKLHMIFEIVEDNSRRLANLGRTFRNYARIDRVENKNDYLILQDNLSTKPELREKYHTVLSRVGGRDHTECIRG